MTPTAIRQKVVTERAGWVREMLLAIRELPLDCEDAFYADRRNVAAAESYLRRALEALLDLGRHLLAKGFAVPTNEYKQVARGLGTAGILDPIQTERLETMAGYRNRMVHFYSEVTEVELFVLCTARISDVEDVLQHLLDWVHDHPEKVDDSL